MSGDSKDEIQILASQLMEYRHQGIDEEYCQKAVKLLVNKSQKLHGSNDGIKDFFNTIEKRGDPVGDCVTVPRSKDGRQTIGGKRVYAHAHFAKIFRWPDLDYRKTDLLQIEVCKYGYERKLPLVCVNPYHYNKGFKNRPSSTGTSKARSEHVLNSQSTSPETSTSNSDGPETYSSSSSGDSLELMDFHTAVEEKCGGNSLSCKAYDIDKIKYIVSISPEPAKLKEELFDHIVEFQLAAPPSDVMPQRMALTPKTEESPIDTTVTMTVNVKMELAESNEELPDLFDLDPHLDLSEFLDGTDAMLDLDLLM